VAKWRSSRKETDWKCLPRWLEGAPAAGVESGLTILLTMSRRLSVKGQGGTSIRS
jgi:hypothetical protein